MTAVRYRVWLYDSARKVSAYVVLNLVRRRNIRGRVLDVGCGHGLLANHIAARTGLSVTGVDINPVLIDVARQSDESDLNEFLVASATQLPLPSQTFEVVTCVEVLEHLDHPLAALSEMRRVLKVGGLLVASVPNERLNAFSKTSHSDHKQHFSITEFSAIVRTAGFRVVWSGYRYHRIGAFIDMILQQVGPKIVRTTELDEHDIAIPSRPAWAQRVVLRSYQYLIDPLVEAIVLREFVQHARRPGASLLVIAEKTGETSGSQAIGPLEEDANLAHPGVVN